ncbi:MAG: glycosyltransferase [Solirubrobacterales bacterium]
MGRPKFVQIPPQPLDRYRPLLGDGYEEIERTAARARRLFAGRAIWHVSSTMRGGGVAEMLRSLLPYVRGAGIDTRWVVLREGADFYTVTKRLHNNLHGNPGDGGELGEDARRTYEAALGDTGRQLTGLSQPGDVVYLHDPQTAGLAPALRECGLKVIWRCHIGVDNANELVRRGWDFLGPYLESADAFVFSRREYLWDNLDQTRVWILPPSLDPFSAKNQELSVEAVAEILGAIGLCPRQAVGAPTFRRADGTPGRVERAADLFQVGPVPKDAKLIAQVSRWDALKDHLGVLECFANLDLGDVHLALAGPAPEAVADDPEADAVLGRLVEAWKGLDPEVRRRAHLVVLPMGDIDENGAMVNALQRRSDVLIQKSIAEGFGLTVAEGMLKRRPVIASRVGGIQDQIVDGESGILIDDPRDLVGFGRAIRELLEDPVCARRIGEAARRRVIDRFLAVSRLREYVDLVGGLIGPQL